MGRGVNFTGNGWTAGNLKDVLTALNFAQAYLGSKTDKVLGLTNGGSLNFNLLPTRQDPSGQGGQAHPELHSIDLRLMGTSNPLGTFTVLHEIGHFVSVKLGNAYGPLSESGGWFQASKWSVVNKKSVLDANYEGDTVSSYGWKNPGEDFADTFAWTVEDAVGNANYVNTDFRVPSSDRINYMDNLIFGNPYSR